MSEYRCATRWVSFHAVPEQTQGIKELAVRLLDGWRVGRSNTRPSVSRGQVAQLVEQRIENPRVGGSIPPLATILRRPLSVLSRLRSLQAQVARRCSR
jgi:hypothetical protein